MSLHHGLLRKTAVCVVPGGPGRWSLCSCSQEGSCTRANLGDPFSGFPGAEKLSWDVVRAATSDSPDTTHCFPSELTSVELQVTDINGEWASRADREEVAGIRGGRCRPRLGLAVLPVWPCWWREVEVRTVEPVPRASSAPDSVPPLSGLCSSGSVTHPPSDRSMCARCPACQPMGSLGHMAQDALTCDRPPLLPGDKPPDAAVTSLNISNGDNRSRKKCS